MTINLYTLEQVQKDVLPFGDKLSKAKLETAVLESKCYREVAGLLFMTDSDILDFLTWCSPRKSGAGEPAETDVGQIVAISNPLDKDGLVYVAWTPRGQELELLERIQDGCPERVSIATVFDAAYGTYTKLVAGWKERKLGYRAEGKWYTSKVLPDLMEMENAFELEEETGEVG